MKKRLILACITVVVLIFSVSVVGSAVAAKGSIPLDVGNHNDYDGGGWDAGGWDAGGWDSDDGWDSDWGSSSGSGVSMGLGGAFTVIPVVVIIVLFIILRANKGKTGSAGSGFQTRPTQYPPAVQNFDDQITAEITKNDEFFSKEKFLGWTKEVFITLQNAWTERDWSKIRPFEKEELFKLHERQLQEYINLGRINVMERINVNQAYMNLYRRDSQYEYVTVYMNVRMVDYIIDENTKAVLKGDPNTDCHMQYLLTFMRKKGVVTNPATSNKSTVSCPHCGAPVQITSAGQCEYCDFIITTGEHDWVLVNLDSIKPNTQVDNRGIIINE